MRSRNGTPPRVRIPRPRGRRARPMLLAGSRDDRPGGAGPQGSRRSLPSPGRAGSRRTPVDFRMNLASMYSVSGSPVGSALGPAPHRPAPDRARAPARSRGIATLGPVILAGLVVATFVVDGGLRVIV